MNKDFYNDLPGCVCEILEDFIKQFGQEEWFGMAWEEYRQHILSSSMDDMKMPGYVFNKYLESKGE